MACSGFAAPMSTVADISSSGGVSAEEAETASAALGAQIDQVRKVVDDYRALAEAAFGRGAADSDD